MTSFDEFNFTCIKEDADWLARNSQTAKNGAEYGAYVDTFVTLVMIHCGYYRKEERTIEEIETRKEVWRKVGEEDGKVQKELERIDGD